MTTPILVYDLNVESHHGLGDYLRSHSRLVGRAPCAHAHASMLDECVIVLIHATNDPDGELARQALAKGKPVVLYSWGGCPTSKTRALTGSGEARVRACGPRELLWRLSLAARRDSSDKAGIENAFFGFERWEPARQLLTLSWLLSALWERDGRPDCLPSANTCGAEPVRAFCRTRIEGGSVTWDGEEARPEGSIGTAVDAVLLDEDHVPCNPWSGSKLTTYEVWSGLREARDRPDYDTRLAQLRDALLDWANE